MPSVRHPHLDQVALNKLIVVGASAGGIETISELLSLIAPPLRAAMLVVVHTSPGSPGVLPAILGRRTRLRVKRAEHGDQLADGFVYVAPPDKHVLARESRIETSRGPREMRHRPAIDPLFRSAAQAYGARVIGVVLTGVLDDGTAGLAVIKRLGGVAVVQEPADAVFPAMPRSALEHVQVDHRVGIAEMGPLLTRLAEAEAAAAGPVVRVSAHAPEFDVSMAERSVRNGSRNDDIGRASSLGCPECGGPLWEVHDEALRRYRCHLGHALTASSVVDGQTAALERSLCASLRLLEERAKILDKMAADERRHGRGAAAAAYAERSAESQQHACEIRSLLEGKDVS